MISISNEQLRLTKNLVIGFYQEDRTGHDWDHIMRVKNLALKIAEIEGVNNLHLIEMLSYLHDVGDNKLHSSEQKANHFLQQTIEKIGFSEREMEYILLQVKSVSYRNRGIYNGNDESKIVADADRLDAIGAIGIARAFTYGGAKSQKLHSRKNNDDTVISHFYDKLLNLKDEMHTKTAYKIALERHRFLEIFTDQFLNEWNGKK
ncbi:HD domain-containing protein [Jeotgalibacillus salarius]|uniref:HD domain-containing protein n=1 Tax=Jeotgalibacillus salarius TaxID=546023 RepID=A0A4Y8LQ12_9BACL|nr:HD domain-containing protein [Jeotgalibacillus salarius]TFE03027.1 HD domain-containing protein [Jeotgalibacillus salarius]